MSRILGQEGGRRHTRAILASLALTEVPQVLDAASEFPVVLCKADGSRVRDADGNRYIDLTSFFGVATVGHRNPSVLAALRIQSGRLLHAMGDVHPADVKARFLREISRRLPSPDYKAVLSLNGADAVETALKFAAAATGRPGVIAFEGSYHGLSAGALDATHLPAFRAPFTGLLSGRARFVPFPSPDGSNASSVLDAVRATARAEGPFKIGAVMVEPIQGRGGIRVPPPGFLRDLATVCAAEDLVLIADEVYTGVGRTGRFLRMDAEEVVPDAVCLGKSLGGGIPLSGCWMRPRLADAVHRAGAEAVHTSTYLGHPLGCAAGLGVLKALDRGHLMQRAAEIEVAVRERAAIWRQRSGLIRDVRGAGAMIGVELQTANGGPGAPIAGRVIARAMRGGVILLTEGPAGDVLSFTPPLSILPEDLQRALTIVERALLEEMTTT
jgi:4-aminobutyrate aminotransferase/(S)-3-amino-2-methylpropionate transaminase